MIAFAMLLAFLVTFVRFLDVYADYYGINKFVFMGGVLLFSVLFVIRKKLEIKKENKNEVKKNEGNK